jgi:putative DNA primase/helicase
VSGQPDKWDAGNAIRDDKWTAAEIDEWVKPRLRARRKEAPAAETKPEQEEKPKAAPRLAARGDADPLNVGTDKHGVVPLGHNHGLYYYYSKGRKQVVTLAAASHKKLELMALASTSYYWERSKFAGEKGVSWDAAAAYLMDCCHAVGVFDSGRIRGRGAWLDNSRSVLHLGDRLLVDGEERDIFLEGSKYVYEHAVTLSQTIAPPLTGEEAKAILKIFEKFDWERSIHGRLLAGWVAVAPICGALAWRPSIWLTGPSASGKSTLTSVIALTRIIHEGGGCGASP